MTKNLDEKVESVDYFFHIMSPPSYVDYPIWPQIPSSYRYVNQSPMHGCMFFLNFIHFQIYVGNQASQQ